MNKLLAVLCAFLIAASSGVARAGVALNPDVTVTGGVIHLGDFFTNAGADAQATVAAAPALGMRATYSAAWLGALARAHHLAWAPASEFDQAAVIRASRYIDADTIAHRLLEAMAPSIAGGDAVIHLDNPALRLLVPAEADDGVAVEGVTLDARTGRFSAFVSAPPGAADAQRLRVSGRLIVEIAIAVPNHVIAINEVLTARDIERINFPRERLALDTITDVGQLVGKSAAHMLRAEQPVRAGDVQEPVLVRKGDLVIIELRSPTMELSAQGKALEDGAAGSSIRVTNTQSNRTIDVTVTGPDLVRAGLREKFAAR
jgi:flagella basal body P-ring formation protein FlgA